MSANRFLLLRADLDREIRQLAALVEVCRRQVERTTSHTPDDLELRGIGSLLHDFYTGSERIFERIANELDGELPHGSDWHAELLRRMSQDIPDVRPAAILDTTAAQLRPYLRFRHLFRNIYGAELRWDRLRELLEGVDGAWIAMRDEIARFQDTLGDLSGDCGDSSIQDDSN